MKKPMMCQIARAVADHFNISVEDLRGPRRFRKVAYPRFLFCLMARELACKTYPEIGIWLGGRDHTTIAHAEHRALGLIEADEAMSKAFLSIRNRIMEAA